MLPATSAKFQTIFFPFFRKHVFLIVDNQKAQANLLIFKRSRKNARFSSFLIQDHEDHLRTLPINIPLLNNRLLLATCRTLLCNVVDFSSTHALPVVLQTINYFSSNSVTFSDVTFKFSRINSIIMLFLTYAVISRGIFNLSN